MPYLWFYRNQTMYITDIEISDLRGFKGSHSVSLAREDGSYAGWTVFAGRNGAGKSTLLKAIALTVVGPLASRSLAGVFTDWIRRGSEEASVAVKIDIDTAVDTFKSGRPNKTPFWLGLCWSRGHQRNDVVDRLKPKTQENVADRGPWAENQAGWFIAAYGPYRHLGPPSAEVIKLSMDPVLARLINLFNEAATLSDAIEWLIKQVHLRALENKPGMESLKREILAILGDGLLPDGSEVKGVDSEGLWIERDGATIKLEQVSDGYRTVAALVVDLLRRLYESYGSLDIEKLPSGKIVCRKPGVVLIDEIDAHLHVAWQQEIGFWLTERFPAIQFIVTTHSPFICQAAGSKGIIRLPAPGEERTIEHIKESTWRSVVNGGADDAVITELFGLEHAHSKKAENIRKELSELENLVLNGKASEKQISEYQKLKGQISEDLGTLADIRLRSLLGTN